MRKELIILANSIKHGKHCVAGKCVSSGEWIRPVSNDAGGELSSDQIKAQNIYGNFSVKPLQRVEMDFIRHVPLKNHQPENYLVSSIKWKQRFKIDKSDLITILDNPVNLWGGDSRVQYTDINNLCINSSLYLVQVSNLNLIKNFDEKRKARFVYMGIEYVLPVTDPYFDTLYENMKSYDKAILTVSLGENFKGFCYKIVASIFI